MAGQEMVTLPLPPEKLKPSGTVSAETLSASAPRQNSAIATASAKNLLNITSPPHIWV